ncbi:hypothetical protein [Halorubrum vacuolatum]|uniref:Uncharacterized protein n=1 Tax=Halorubrum vacuolatum TaxID=63740 RepID=A0A238WTQ8_HALVU|nr:hypothetical protein [Halorubrum vacuolatum]SNR49927.1 hypothetical protein SAMN06264855_11034 [Halorubrum vacuolatum]
MGVTYNDAANANFDFTTDDSSGAASIQSKENAEAIVWQKPTPPKEASSASDLEAEEAEINPNDRNLRNILADGPDDEEDKDSEDWKVVAIEFPNQDVAFFHPGWDAGEFDDVRTSEGVKVDLDADLTANDVHDRSFVASDDDADDD